jgi:hydroxyacylglutathione hydrolase
VDGDFPTVAIVGGGASGTLTAIHLLRSQSTHRFGVLLIKGDGPVGRGTAYATPHRSHLLNVRASGMSAYRDEPLNFVSWLEEQGQRSTCDSFVQRALFGQYLEDQLSSLIAETGERIPLEVLSDEVVDIEPASGQRRLVLRGGRRIPVQAVILATGGTSHHVPQALATVTGERVILDPWRADGLQGIGTHESVTILGSGLTALDCTLALSDLGHQGSIRMVSRHGLLPLDHSPTVGSRQTRLEPERVVGETARTLLHNVRRCARTFDGHSDSGWREVIDGLRPLTATLWGDLPLDERQRFMRHVSRYWEIHRHRMAPDAASVISQMRARGQLRVSPGRLLGVVADDDGLSLTVKAKEGGHTAVQRWTSDWLINCTGPERDVCAGGDPLLTRLTAGGTLAPGPLGMGVDADENGRVRDREGRGVDWLWAIGALLRGRVFETTAIPEIRSQAQDLAAQVLKSFDQNTPLSGVGHEARHPSITPSVSRPASPMQVVSWESADLGDRSYLVHDGNVAVVVDPQRDSDRFKVHAERLGVTITHVLETHVHNDYISGALTLARRTGSRYVLSANEPVSFEGPRLGVGGGDVIRSGSLAVEVVHTPGHTPHHLSFVVRDSGGQGALFSGGSMLRGSTGRTDLFDGRAAHMMARAQWRSVRLLSEMLSPATPLFPTHGFGSFCASDAVSVEGPGTIARELEVNPALLHDELSFVTQTLANLRPHPRYYAHMAPLNRRGLCLPGSPAIHQSVAREIRDDGSLVVDLRPRRTFAQAHLKGSINIEWGTSFAAYAGWTLPWGAPLTILAGDWRTIELAAHSMARIGVDTVTGVLHDEAVADSSYRVVEFTDLCQVIEGCENPIVMDARDEGEWTLGHVEGAEHVPFYCVEAAATLFPAAVPIWVHCARGMRAAIAASLLERFGRTPVLVDDSFDRAVELGLVRSAEGVAHAS